MRVRVNKHKVIAYSTFLRFMRLVRSHFALPESWFVSIRQSRSVSLFHTFKTVHKTLLSETLWAHNRRASWDPFVSSATQCRTKAQPSFPSPDRYGRIIIPKRYLEDRNTLVCVSNVGTTVNVYLYYRKANERVPPTQAFAVNLTCATFFSKMAKFECLSRCISETRSLNQNLI